MRMGGTDYLQLIPLLALTLYFLYLTYYYAAPMFCLKVLLFYAHIKYPGADIRFADGKITMRYGTGGEEGKAERRLETDPTSRFFAMTVCSEFRGMLREIRRGSMDAKEDDAPPAGERACGTGKHRTEEDCD